MDITERFLNYTKFDTQSAEDSDTVPSTPKQVIFAEYLKKELDSEGFSDVEMDDKAYIYATLKANTKGKIPTLVLFHTMTPVLTAQVPIYKRTSSRTTMVATFCFPKASSAVQRNFQNCSSTSVKT